MSVKKRKIASSSKIEVKVDVSGEYRSSQGIHLTNPTETKLNQTLAESERDVHIVWVHWDNVVCLDFERSKRKVG